MRDYQKGKKGLTMPVKVILKYEYQDKKIEETCEVSLANLFHVKQLLKNVFDIKWEKNRRNSTDMSADRSCRSKLANKIKTFNYTQ